MTTERENPVPACEECRSRLDEWRRGELAPAEAHAVEQHLDQCPECAEELAAAEQIGDLLRRTLAAADPEMPQLPPDYFARVSDRVRARTREAEVIAISSTELPAGPESRAPQQVRSGQRWWWAMAAGLLLLAGSSWIVLRSGGGPFSRGDREIASAATPQRPEPAAAEIQTREAAADDAALPAAVPASAPPPAPALERRLMAAKSEEVATGEPAPAPEPAPGFATGLTAQADPPASPGAAEKQKVPASAGQMALQAQASPPPAAAPGAARVLLDDRADSAAGAGRQPATARAEADRVPMPAASAAARKRASAVGESSSRPSSVPAQAAAAAPERAEDLYGRAEEARRTENYREAVRLYEEAIRLEPESPTAARSHVRIGELSLEKLNDPEQAREAFSAALSPALVRHLDASTAANLRSRLDQIR